MKSTTQLNKPIARFLSCCLLISMLSVQVHAGAGHGEGAEHSGNENDHAHIDEKNRNHEEDHDDHKEEHDSGDKHEHKEEQSTRIDDGMAAQVGIKITNAESQVLRQSIVVYGSLATDPGQVSHVRARYSGLISSVRYTVGDTIKQGDLLAEVESNESLKTYSIRSPISGIVIQRHANTGEVTQDQVLFSIANFDTLWAEFRIYSSQQSVVKAGQTAYVDMGEQVVGNPIQHIIPALDKPYQLARVKFDNRSKELSPGLLVEGDIIVGEFRVDLAIEKAAIQNLGGQSGVFVKNDSEYIFTSLRLGRADNRYVEVLSGLNPGQSYVNENSYLIKADIEKSEAEHEH